MKLLTDNRSARHKYEMLETLTAGLVLEGWEVKAIRAGKAQISDAYVVLSRGEFFLLNCHISPLLSASTHITPEQTRSRKLLLTRKEMERLTKKVKEKGLALVPLNLSLQRGNIKSTIALAKGKKQHDKRRTIEERQWKRDQARILRGKK